MSNARSNNSNGYFNNSNVRHGSNSSYGTNSNNNRPFSFNKNKNKPWWIRNSSNNYPPSFPFHKPLTRALESEETTSKIWKNIVKPRLNNHTVSTKSAIRYMQVMRNMNTHEWHDVKYNMTKHQRRVMRAKIEKYNELLQLVKKLHYARRWVEAPHPPPLQHAMVNVKLPANARDPISLHNFAPGNEAIMVIKKRIGNDRRVRTKRYYMQRASVEQLAQLAMQKPVSWRQILRMKSSDRVFTDPLNRRAVYRRNLMHVRFV